ncbi:MICOS complex subunit Mic19 isoform X2 [Aplysia californica]|uniref:MICOS complex subunit Mic19 isoform X2 n=1 Tax=Aplysia californica TaxID=6500 RepID=A0ABM0JWM4_APLCA|nr:MICOS complex subunit Mic19 isoform X2 [Aplysia californica]
MGGSGSTTRRVVVEDAGDDVVKISEAVVRRLKGIPDRDNAGSDVPPPIPSPTSRPDQRLYSQEINQEVEDFYVQKLKELQERNAALQKQTNDQFAKAVKEVEEKFVNYTASPVCQDLQTKVLQCYQDNANEVLNCSAIVNAFSTCVDRARMAASSSRMQTVS